MFNNSFSQVDVAIDQIDDFPFFKDFLFLCLNICLQKRDNVNLIILNVSSILSIVANALLQEI